MGIEELENIFSNVVYPDEISYFRENAIYVILGMNCNLNCIYCLNRNNGHADFPSTISPSFEKYFCELLPKTLAEEKRMLQFWGGEPLLYFEQIKRIVMLIKDIPNYVKLIVTNGLLLTDEIVDFLNEHQIRLSVSHDGVFCRESRGINVLENSNIVRLIHKSQFFTGFSSVISSKCSNLYSMDKYFSSIMNPTHAHFSITPFYDTEGAFEFDKQLASDMREFTDNVKRKALDGTLLQSKEMDWLAKHLYSYLFYHQNKRLFENDLFHVYVNTDLAGNVYLDHDGRWRIGSLDMDIREFIDSSNSLFSKKISRFDACKSCISYPMCRGGVILPKNNKLRFCKTVQGFFNPIVKLLEEDIAI